MVSRCNRTQGLVRSTGNASRKSKVTYLCRDILTVHCLCRTQQQDVIASRGVSLSGWMYVPRYQRMFGCWIFSETSHSISNLSHFSLLVWPWRGEKKFILCNVFTAQGEPLRVPFQTSQNEPLPTRASGVNLITRSRTFR